MKKINDIETLKVFETHYIAENREKILVWNPITKEVYQSLKRKVKDSDRKYAKMIEEERASSTYSKQLPPGLESLLKKTTERLENKAKEKDFYTRRITERNSYPTAFLLEAELLPEELLRDIYLKKADTFTLVRANDIYVGILSKKFDSGFLSMVNNLSGENILENNSGFGDIGGMSIIPIMGGGNKW